MHSLHLNCLMCQRVAHVCFAPTGSCSLRYTTNIDIYRSIRSTIIDISCRLVHLFRRRNLLDRSLPGVLVTARLLARSRNSLLR